MANVTALGLLKCKLICRTSLKSREISYREKEYIYIYTAIQAAKKVEAKLRQSLVQTTYDFNTLTLSYCFQFAVHVFQLDKS